MKDYEFYGYPAVLKEKYQDYENLSLNIDTAEKIYYLVQCNTALFLEPTALDFYKNNFGLDVVLVWNEKYVDSEIDRIRLEMKESISKNKLKAIINSICVILKIYIEDSIVINKLIDLLIELKNKYGSFIFHNIIGEDHEFNSIFKSLINIYDKDFIGTANNLTSIGKFYPNTEYEGFIPMLKMNGYDSSFKRLKNEILDKVIEIDSRSKETMKLVNLNIFDNFRNHEFYTLYLDYVKKM